MRASNMNGHDGFLRADRTGAMRHRHGPDAKRLDGFFRKPLEHGIEFVLPGVEFKAVHLGIAFGFAGDAEKTHDGPAARGWKTGQQLLRVEVRFGFFNHHDTRHETHDNNTSFKPHASMGIHGRLP